MTIKIKRNEAGNCINFEGSSNPVYWNSCLSGEVDSVEVNSVNVINDIITANTGTTQYEFFRIPFTEFTDADGNGFADAQTASDYITAQANVVGLSGDGIDLTDETVCFSLDATSTSIMLDTGHAYGVNTIKAIADADGTIHIVSNDGADDITHFHHLDAANTCVNGATVSGGLQDVANTLNELFTVGAFQSVVIADPYSTMIADVAGVVTTEAGGAQGTAIETGTDEYGATVGSYNSGGYKTPETINQAGEYFTFDIRNEGIIGFGLVVSDTDYANGDYNGNASYANPTSFCNGPNSGNYGYQFSHWFHPSPNGPWTNYGANAAYSMREGWSNATWKFSGSPEGAKWLAGDLVKIKVGIDENNFIVISYFDESTLLFVPIARTTYPVPNGNEYHLGIKFGDTTVRMVGLPKIHELEELAPTMNFRYIESPDDNFHYPLFATEEEANYFDLHNGGTGTSSTNVYPDEPTYAQWYESTNGHTHNGTTAPTNAITFEGNPINWTEITSLANADLAPSSFLDWNLTTNELSAVNIAVAPADASFTTTVTDVDGSGLILLGLNIEGTAPEVTGDYNTNPSDVYTLTVTRTNSYGSTSATLTLTVVNLTAPVSAISGFNHISGTTAMIDSDTMDDGSVVHINNTVADGERFVIEKAYVETNILPSLNATNDKYIIGLSNQPETFGTLELSDFDTAIIWEYESSSSHTFKFYRDGSVVQNIVINSMTQAFYDYAIEVNGTSAWLIACNINNIMNEASPADGGTFSNTYEATSIEDTAPVTIHMATLNTSGDISATDISTITTPTPAPTILTSWDKALDFSGSNEHLKQVNSSYSSQPLQMGKLAQIISSPSTTGNTAHSVSARPWATSVVFKSDGHASSQIIWNQGEGYNNGDDNIYLRLSASGSLFFGWGRQGTGVNECRIINQTVSSSTWYGVAVVHTGERLGGNNASASNLADCFDIRVMSSADSFASLSSNLSTSSNWIYTGNRMDRSIEGDFSIGGSTNTSYQTYRGKVASMVVTTLKIDDAMPTASEIELMISDPVKWANDYKVGNSFRRPIASGNTANFLYNNGGSYAYIATQIWLMGDGTSDSYANGIRSQVLDYEQNNVKLQLNSMVSNDIENVSISGLS